MSVNGFPPTDLVGSLHDERRRRRAPCVGKDAYARAGQCGNAGIQCHEAALNDLHAQPIPSHASGHRACRRKRAAKKHQGNGTRVVCLANAAQLHGHARARVVVVTGNRFGKRATIALRPHDGGRSAFKVGHARARGRRGNGQEAVLEHADVTHWRSVGPHVARFGEKGEVGVQHGTRVCVMARLLGQGRRRDDGLRRVACVEPDFE